MPVQKFRDPDEARDAMWTRRDDPNLIRRIRKLWGSSARLAGTWRAEGVHKYRSIEEAAADRERALTERVRALRARRVKP